MPVEHSRWDPNSPGFVIAVLRMIIGSGILVCLLGTALYRPGFWGFLSGCLFAIALYVIAVQAGRVFQRSHAFAQVMLWLLLSQFVLWVGMALLLAVAKVNPLGFVIGVSVLPTAVVLTLGWYAFRRRRLPS